MCPVAVPSRARVVPSPRHEPAVAHRLVGTLLVLLASYYLPDPAAWAQEPLFPVRRVRPEFPRLDHSFYVNARYFIRQTGYEGRSGSPAGGHTPRRPGDAASAAAPRAR